jgi:tripartite-type tricarboxylate transporter receptor subunit TctC
MSEKLGQSIVIENVVGAGGNLATQAAAKSTPDGYTILMANQGPMAVNPHIFKNLTVDPLTAFDPVTLIAAAPLLVVVPAKSPYTTFKDLIDDARANPGKLTYGSAGNGSASHLASLLLNVVAKLDTVHLPYKGAGPALNDLLGAQSGYMLTTIPSVIGLVETGQLRALAVTTKTRAAILPNVPTIAESGWPDYESSAWYGFVVPKGTPTEVITIIRDATVASINAPTIRARLDGEGAQPIGNTPVEFAAFMKADSARWAVIAKSGAIGIN